MVIVRIFYDDWEYLGVIFIKLFLYFIDGLLENFVLFRDRNFYNLYDFEIKLFMIKLSLRIGIGFSFCF